MFKVMMVLMIITIEGRGGRDKKATWSRLQTASPACRCRRRESRRNFNAGSDVWRLFLQSGCNRNIVINSSGSKYCSEVIKYTRHWGERGKIEKIFKIFSGRLKQRTWVGETETVAGSGQIRVGRHWDRAVHCTTSNSNQKYKYKNKTDTNTNKHKYTENTGENTNWCHKVHRCLARYSPRATTTTHPSTSTPRYCWYLCGSKNQSLVRLSDWNWE